RHILQHLDAIFQIAHAAALVVAPGNGNLANHVLQLASDEENLGIEAPAFDCLETEDRLRCRATECLETALRVFEGQADHGAGDPVETSSEELAIERLVNRLPRSVHPAGSNGNIGSVMEGSDQALGLFHRC